MQILCVCLTNVFAISGFRWKGSQSPETIPMVNLRTEAYGRDGLIGLGSLVGILWWETDGGMRGTAVLAEQR